MSKSSSKQKLDVLKTWKPFGLEQLKYLLKGKN